MGHSQFLLLIWKNFLLQKRKPVATVFEIVLPMAFAFILIGVKQVRIRCNMIILLFLPNCTTYRDVVLSVGFAQWSDSAKSLCVFLLKVENKVYHELFLQIYVFNMLKLGYFSKYNFYCKTGHFRSINIGKGYVYNIL